MYMYSDCFNELFDECIDKSHIANRSHNVATVQLCMGCYDEHKIQLN